jgi:hypothetical protein
MPTSYDKQKRTAAKFFSITWEQAIAEGIEPDVIAATALSAALASLVKTQGREAAARTAERLAEAARMGKFDIQHSSRALNEKS